MAKVIYSFLIILWIGCNKKQESCGTKIPQFTNCVDGQFACFDGYTKVNGTKADMGCVKKGQYDFRCLNPCPPYNQILLSSDKFLPKESIGSVTNNMIPIFFTTDYGNINNPNDWNSPTELQFFINDKLSNDKQLYMETSGICDLYRIWSEEKKAFSQAKIKASLNATKDTLRFHCRYGWDKNKAFEENECNLVFIRDKNLQ